MSEKKIIVPQFANAAEADEWWFKTFGKRHILPDEPPQSSMWEDEDFLYERARDREAD